MDDLKLAKYALSSRPSYEGRGLKFEDATALITEALSPLV